MISTPASRIGAPPPITRHTYRLEGSLETITLTCDLDVLSAAADLGLLVSHDDGSADWRIDDRHISAGPGDVLVILPDSRIIVMTEDDLRTLILALSPSAQKLGQEERR